MKLLVYRHHCYDTSLLRLHRMYPGMLRTEKSQWSGVGSLSLLEVYIGSDINGQPSFQQTRTRPYTRAAKTGRPEPDPTVNYLT